VTGSTADHKRVKQVLYKLVTARPFAYEKRFDGRDPAGKEEVPAIAALQIPSRSRCKRDAL